MTTSDELVVVHAEQRTGGRQKLGMKDDLKRRKVCKKGKKTLLTLLIRKNKPGTAKVGAISKAQNLKGGPFGLCETPAGCKKFFKKMKGGPFGDMKKFPKIFLMRILNSVTVPKNVKGGTLCDF